VNAGSGKPELAFTLGGGNPPININIISRVRLKVNMKKTTKETLSLIYKIAWLGIIVVGMFILFLKL